MKTEIWKDVSNYEGLYQVSNLGNIKSLNYGRTGEERLLKPVKNNDGYLLVTLCKNGKPKRYLVHRLVASAFLPNPNNLKEINHKDENSLNNRIENLEWCDRKYNCNYGTRTKRLIATRCINDPNNESYKKMVETRAKKSSVNAEKSIIQYTKDMIEVGRYKSLSEAERQTGIPYQNIGKCCKGKLKSCGGYIWRYL